MRIHNAEVVRYFRTVVSFEVEYCGTDPFTGIFTLQQLRRWFYVVVLCSVRGSDCSLQIQCLTKKNKPCNHGLPLAAFLAVKQFRQVRKAI